MGDRGRATRGTPSLHGTGRRVLLRADQSRASSRERLARAHVLVATSIREGWGLNVSEAAACGTPTIGYSVPGLVDSVRASGGALVEPTPTALGTALVDFFAGELRLEPSDLDRELAGGRRARRAPARRGRRKPPAARPVSSRQLGREARSRRASRARSQESQPLPHADAMGEHVDRRDENQARGPRVGSVPLARRARRPTPLQAAPPRQARRAGA